METNKIDGDVIRQARKGDPAAFEQLVRAYDKSLRTLVCRLVGWDGTDDVLQESYLKAFQALPRFRPRRSRSLGPWLHTIAYNTAMDHLRASTRRPSASLSDVVSASRAIAPTAEPEQWLDLSEALAALPLEARAAVVLVDALGFDYATAAAVLGVPRGTVASRLNAARKLLRSALREEDPQSIRSAKGGAL